MTAREMILSRRLAEKIAAYPEYSKQIGISLDKKTADKGSAKNE